MFENLKSKLEGLSAIFLNALFYLCVFSLLVNIASFIYEVVLLGLMLGDEILFSDVAITFTSVCVTIGFMVMIKRTLRKKKIKRL